MAVPKRKVSRSRRGKRRTHRTLRPTHPGRCPDCGAYKQPHRVCLVCGHYKKRAVLPSGSGS